MQHTEQKMLTCMEVAHVQQLHHGKSIRAHLDQHPWISCFGRDVSFMAAYELHRPAPAWRQSQAVALRRGLQPVTCTQHACSWTFCASMVLGAVICKIPAQCTSGHRQVSDGPKS